jgi:hypothetical protein
MSRLLVLLLVLLNAGYFAWSHGLLRAYGFAPVLQTETYRLTQQIRPELVRVLPASEARGLELAAQAAPPAAECLQAGLFDETQAAALRRAAQSVLPAGSWLLDAATEPARWIVYMGKYPDAQTLLKKRSELAALNLRFEPLTNPALDFGLSLGSFETEARANEGLAALAKQGVHTAHVVQDRPELKGAVFRIPVVDAVLKARLSELNAVLAGKSLRACG